MSDGEQLIADGLEAEAGLDHQAALASYEAARARAGNVAVGREGRRRAAALQLKLGHNDRARASFDALIADCEAADAQAELAEALAERAHVAYRTGDGPAILAFATRAVAIARAAQSPELVAHALRYLGIAHEFAGRHADAEASYLELLDVAPGTRHLGPVCNSLGEIARASGRFATAVSWYQRSHEEWRKTRGDEPDVVYLNNRGAALVGLGAYAEARTYLDRAIAEQRRGGFLAMLSETYHYRAVSWLEEGQLAHAERDVLEGYLLAAELGEGEMLGILLRLLARIRQRQAPRATVSSGAGGSAPSAAERGLDAGPVQLAEQSIALLREAHKPAEVAESQWRLGEILAAGGELAAARSALAEAQASFAALGLTTWADVVEQTRLRVPDDP